MNTVRRVGQKIDAYRCYLQEDPTEWMIVVAIAGILLSAGDSLCSWVLSMIAPSLAYQFDALEKGRRVLLVGAPSAGIYLAATIAIRWWGMQRQVQWTDPSAAPSRDQSDSSIKRT